MLDIIVVKNENDLNKCLEIRNIVFIEEKNVPIEIERDNYDLITENCTHFLVKYDNKCIGTLRKKKVDLIFQIMSVISN